MNKTISMTKWLKAMKAHGYSKVLTWHSLSEGSLVPLYERSLCTSVVLLSECWIASDERGLKYLWKGIGDYIPYTMCLKMLDDAIELGTYCPHRGRILIISGHLCYSNDWSSDKELLEMAYRSGYISKPSRVPNDWVRPGLASWAVRCQVSSEMGLKAMTGLRTSDMTIAEAQALVTVDGGRFLGKTIEFVNSSLRSPKDLVKYGGDVTMQYSDQDFRVRYNNTRKMDDFITNPVWDDEIGGGSYVGMTWSSPWNTIDECLTARAISSTVSSGSIYQRNTSKPGMKKYKSYAEIGIRSFIKDVVNNRNGVSLKKFGSYNRLIDFINKYLYSATPVIKVGRKLNSSYVSRVMISSMGKVPKRKCAPDRVEVRNFLLYVRSHFAMYDPSLILEDRYVITPPLWN